MISACSVFLQAGNMIQWKSPSLSLYIWQFLCARALLKSRWVLSHRPSITMLRSIKPHFVWESHSNGTAICGKQELRFRSYKAWLVTFQMTSTFAPWRCTGLQRRKQNFCTMSKYFVCVCVCDFVLDLMRIYSHAISVVEFHFISTLYNQHLYPKSLRTLRSWFWISSFFWNRLFIHFLHCLNRFPLSQLEK